MKPKAVSLPAGQPTLEHRIATLESEFDAIRAWLANAGVSPTRPWWERLVGSFANDPLFDELVAAGQAYRRVQNKRSRS